MRIEKEQDAMDMNKAKTPDNFNKISNNGAIMYLSSHIESLKEKVEANDSLKPLYEEQILFFSKALEMCRAYGKRLK